MGGFFATYFIYPLLNILMYLYDTVAFGNLGVAVVEMTIGLRLVLLPLTILSERDAAKFERMEKEVEKIQDSFKNDQVMAHEQVRELLKKNKVSHWAKTSVLLIQLVVLYILYLVFLHGINNSLDGLYSWVPVPATPINTDFLGLDIGRRLPLFSLTVGILLYLEIIVEQKKIVHLLGRSDAIYRYGFPIFSVVVLSLLPAVKTVFILTTMFFTLLISFIRHSLWPTD